MQIVIIIGGQQIIINEADLDPTGDRNTYVPIIPPTSEKPTRKPIRDEDQPEKRAPPTPHWIPPQAPQPEQRMYSIADRVNSLYESRQYSN